MLRLLLSFTIIGIVSCSPKKFGLNSNEILTNNYNRLNKIVFVNEQIGYIVGGEQYKSPTILKTMDGGLNWKPVTMPANYEKQEIYNIATTSDGNFITSGFAGSIFIGRDTGNSVQYVQHQSWKELRDIAFINPSKALIVGGVGFNEGHISNFIPDGSGANTITELRNFELSDVDFVDSSTGYISGYGAVLKSTDGGSSWNFTDAKNDFFKAMAWKNVNEGVAVGYEGSIIKTLDGGDTWKVIRNGNDISKKKIHFLDIARNSKSTLVAVGEKGRTFFSSDDGNTWSEAANFTYVDLRGVCFKNDQTFYTVGENGRLYEIVF